ncbi:MFS transporter [Vulcanisaeta distributa]|uniref:Major facilitator superfamily MFS_1 n=1 Tax=Vulcanisaeta distributa (strain DSM 14429 / JCM 11212 / NBRC 100878 / IC-017) TaxID=572478 RepID=E1QR71_VULDI|nr:MFS transporter [Vulcanisaeta distributa]ADN51761.1 major facilitator superfamily MFS_1 [Vulcanisaeta distributa DSM 14429]
MSFRRIGRVGFLLVTANSLSGIIWGANSVILSIYMLSIGISTTLIGVILGLFSLINALGSLVVGYLTDFMDRIKLFTVLSTISGSLILLMTTGMPMIVSIAYLLTALFNRYVVLTAIVGEFAKQRNVSDEVFSLSSSFNVVFSVVGSAMAVLPSYLGRLGYELIFIAEAIAVYLTIPLVLNAIRHLDPTIANVKIERISLKDLGRLRSSWLIKRLLPEALIGLGAGVIIPLFSLWFYLKFHINIASLGIVYAISNATLALGTLMAPTISRLLRSRVISVVMLEGLATGVLAIMPSIYDLPLLLALFIIRNTLMNMANPLLTSLINELVPREERGRVFGLWNMISSIPRAIGPGIGGYLMDIGYLDMPLYITSILYATAVVLFYALLRGVEGRVRVIHGT